MSRSVETISGAKVIYFDASNMTEDYDWNDLQSNLQCELQSRYPSLVLPTETFEPYPYRETQRVLENYHVTVTLSEYCGCGAICLHTRQAEYPELAEHWLDQNYEGLHKVISQFIDELRRIATFSNGEAVFEKVEK